MYSHKESYKNTLQKKIGDDMLLSLTYLFMKVRKFGLSLSRCFCSNFTFPTNSFHFARVCSNSFSPFIFSNSEK